jgi:hypothetical protein
MSDNDTIINIAYINDDTISNYSINTKIIKYIIDLEFIISNKNKYIITIDELRLFLKYKSDNFKKIIKTFNSNILISKRYHVHDINNKIILINWCNVCNCQVDSDHLFNSIDHNIKLIEYIHSINKSNQIRNDYIIEIKKMIDNEISQYRKLYTYNDIFNIIPLLLVIILSIIIITLIIIIINFKC